MADEKGKMAAIGFRIKQELKDTLVQLAQKEKRSLSQYIELTLIEHLKNQAADAIIQGAFLRSL